MLNDLDISSHDNISYATLQCAHFASDPCKPYGDTVCWLVQYLQGTWDKGMTFKPDSSLYLEVFVSAGNWDHKHTMMIMILLAQAMATSSTSVIAWVILKLQLPTEIVLSSTESEYTGLPYTLREVIPLLQFLDEIKAHGIETGETAGNVMCHIFEDSSCTLEMAKV